MINGKCNKCGHIGFTNHENKCKRCRIDERDKKYKESIRKQIRMGLLTI